MEDVQTSLWKHWALLSQLAPQPHRCVSAAAVLGSENGDTFFVWRRDDRKVPLPVPPPLHGVSDAVSSQAKEDRLWRCLRWFLIRGEPSKLQHRLLLSTPGTAVHPLLLRGDGPGSHWTRVRFPSRGMEKEPQLLCGHTVPQPRQGREIAFSAPTAHPHLAGPTHVLFHTPWLGAVGRARHPPAPASQSQHSDSEKKNLFVLIVLKQESKLKLESSAVFLQQKSQIIN